MSRDPAARIEVGGRQEVSLIAATAAGGGWFAAAGRRSADRELFAGRLAPASVAAGQRECVATSAQRATRMERQVRVDSDAGRVYDPGAREDRGDRGAGAGELDRAGHQLGRALLLGHELGVALDRDCLGHLRADHQLDLAGGSCFPVAPLVPGRPWMP